MAQTGTEYPGVRYREHASRRHNGRPDKYFYLRYSVQGVRHEEGLGFSSDGWTAKKAAAILADLRKAHATGAGPQTLAEMRAEASDRRAEAERKAVQEQNRGITLADFLTKYYLPAKKREKATWRTDELRINFRIIPALGAIPLGSITPGHIKDFLDGLVEDKLAQATVTQHFAILRQAYNLASSVTIDGIPLLSGESPLKDMHMSSPENGRINFLSYVQADNLLDLAKRRDMDLHDAIVLALNAGMRLGEVQRLEWQHVDMTHGYISIPKESRRKPGGMLKINAEMAEVLKCRKECRKEGVALVFPAVISGKKRETFSHGFKALVDELGFNAGVTDRRYRIVFHTLRHTFASWLALSGTDIYRIKKLMRHKTLAMTERYAHLIPEATESAVHRLRPPRES